MQIGQSGTFDPNIIANNLFEISRHIEEGGVLDPSRVRICKDVGGGYVLKTNNAFMRLFYHGSKHKEEVQSLVTKTLRHIENAEETVYKNQSRLAMAVQRYSQALAAQGSGKEKDDTIKLKELDLQNDPRLKGLKLVSIEKKAPGPKHFLDETVRVAESHNKIGNVIGRLLRKLGVEANAFFPHKVKSLGGTEEGHLVRTYATDIGFDHMKEGLSIFFSTLGMNLRNLYGRILRSMGFEAKEYDKYRYAHGVDKARIYNTTDTPLSIIPTRVPVMEKMPQPTSYWHGHATLDLQIPVRGKKDPENVATIRVITDPVEGHLQNILYRRQTDFMSPLLESSGPMAFCLSHPHRDHLSEETVLKLRSLQPVMIVPQEEAERFRKLGFKHVVELDWWEEADLTFEQDGEQYSLNFRATPARHWSDMGPFHGGHTSGFQGYLISGHEDGPIYFAGDTAELNYKATFSAGGTAFDYVEYINFCSKKITELRQQVKTESDTDKKTALLEEINYYKQKKADATFLQENPTKTPYLSHIEAMRAYKPAYYFAPGGPDDVREDMRTTHQSSAYGMQAHVEILLMGINHEKMAKDEFLEEAHKKKTVFMHTMTYRLGNLRLEDTPDSIERVLLALKIINPKKLKDLHKHLQGKTAEEQDAIAKRATRFVKPHLATSDQEWRIGLRGYELDVAVQLLKLGEELKFNDGSTLTPQELAILLQETVVVPKIGSNLGLRQDKREQPDKTIF